MINAAEASMMASADDESEQRRIRARLYAPPQGMSRERRRDARPSQGASFDLSQAHALAAQLAAEDARLTGRGR